MDCHTALIHEPAAPLDSDRDLSQRAVCPGCHTPHPSLTQEGLAAGVGWRCTRCGEKWDARRLATVAAYKAWVAAREQPAGAGAAL